MDVLSDVLTTVRLKGAVFFVADLTDPWSVLSPHGEALCQKMPSKPECVSLFHIITEGQCWFKLETGKPFLLREGSVVIFPHGCTHVMGSTLNITPDPVLRLLSFEEITAYQKVEYGGHGAKTQFICGYLLCDQRFNPLLGAVPEVLILSHEMERTAKENPELRQGILPIVPNGWLDTTLKHLAEEVKERSEGGTTMVTRLIELMYVEVLRRYMKNLPQSSGGWLAAVRDHEVGKALRFLHAHPEEKWRVNELAAKVGVSRSALARRFTELIGEPPIQYLAGWRMHLAKSLLLQPGLNLAMIAEKIGYESDIAFNRAFKRHVGQPPAHWRQHALSAEPLPTA